jgi:hypothetical protein
MTSLFRISLLLLLGVLALAAIAAPVFDDRQPRPVTRVFQLKEYLEHPYSDELVSFPVTFAPGECRTASLRLLDDAGTALPCQLTDVTEENGCLRKAKVWFWVDSLPALGQRSFTLYGSKSPKCRAPRCASPITWTPLDADTVEVSTGTFSLRLAGNETFSTPRDPKTVAGPLRGFKGVDGLWRGASELQVESPVLGQSIRLVEQGPLWTTFVSRISFVAPPGTGGTEDGPFYEMRFVLYPNRDFCRVSERSDFPLRLQPMPRDTTCQAGDPNNTDNWRMFSCPADNVRFNCTAGWEADHLFAHDTWSRNYLDFALDRFRCATALRAALPFLDGGWFGVYSTKGKDLFGMVGVDASHWQYPDNTPHPTARTPGCHAEIMFLNEPGKSAYFRMPLARMTRHWLLVVTTREKVIKDPAWVQSQKKKGYYSWFGPRIEPETCYLWQLRYKFGDLPLNKVKDWKLDYVEPQAEHPNLFPEMKDREAVLKNIENFPPMKKHFDMMYTSSPYLQYLKTGKFAPPNDNFDIFGGVNTVKEHLSQGYNAGIYVLSLGQYVPWMFEFSDMVAPAMKAEDWQKMCRYALAGTYILMDDDYWQYTYVRGDTTYLPNFNTCRWASVGMAGLFFKNHPDAPKWIAFSRYYLEKEFDYHITKDGVGEENLGSYYPFAWRMITLLVKGLHDRGIADYRTDPKYLAGARVFIESITPTDMRFDPPRRMFPPIGHHPYNTPNQLGLYEWNALLLQDVDPALAAENHWAWLQCGQAADYHYLMPVNYFWANKDFKTKVPELHSRPLQDFGYIFRNHFPSTAETYMSFKCGRVYYHHDGDEGSFHMYGKGVPLAADGLELIADAKAHNHNAVEILYKDETAKGGFPRGGDILDHFESPAVDWAQGFMAKEKTRRAEFLVPSLHHTDWQRDLLLVKAKDPEGAEYFVDFDQTMGPESSNWNLDVHSEEPTVEPAANGSLCTVRYPGIHQPKYNVGLDVIFVTPANPAIEKVKGNINKDQAPNFPQVEHWFIHSARAPREATLAILYPRRPNAPQPKVTALLNGSACIVEHSDGRDIIFVAPSTVTYNAGGIEFTGKLAVIRDRKDGVTLTLLDGSKLSYKGTTLTARGNVDVK